jgi:hypothetical protein
MKREDLRRLFAQARKLSGETDYVVLGSLAALGQGSPFEAEHGYYLDPISPHVATLPRGGADRLVRIELEPGLAVWFLEPNDAAVSKYARMEARDREWIRAGLQAGIVSLPILDARFAQTAFLDPAESARARKAFDEDRAWLARRRARR